MPSRHLHPGDPCQCAGGVQSQPLSNRASSSQIPLHFDSLAEIDALGGNPYTKMLKIAFKVGRSHTANGGHSALKYSALFCHWSSWGAPTVVCMKDTFYRGYPPATELAEAIILIYICNGRSSIISGPQRIQLSSKFSITALSVTTLGGK